jgi:hypothetical protein
MTWGRRRPTYKSYDWRLAASKDDLREYDAFGPWIYEIKDERDTPRRFRAACGGHYGAPFLLKVPRKVERRDARPGMDLYVAVLAVHDHGVSLMRLTDESVVTQDLVWSDVAMLESYKDLLYSRMTLMLRDGGAFALEYNTVSSTLIREVTDFVRSHWTPHGEAPRALEPNPVVTIADLVFQNELDAKRRSGPQSVVPIHAEPANRYCRDAANRHRLSTGVMFLDAPDELIVINRGEPTRRFLEARYAMNCVFVPYAAVTSFALVRPPTGRAKRFHELTLQLDKQVFRQSCLVAPERVLARLAAHGAPQTSE